MKSKSRNLFILFLVILFIFLLFAVFVLKPSVENKNQQNQQNQNIEKTENLETEQENLDEQIENTENLLKNNEDEQNKEVQNDFSKQKPSAPENSPLYFGNPSGATSDKENKTNYLITKQGYTLSYNSETLIPNLVLWHLDSSDIGESGRADNFRPDETLPKGWYAVKKADYQYTKYGFDRGHVCPSADRTSDEEKNSETFYMTNMIPQAPDLNRIVWKDLEAFERSEALSGKEVYIAAGPNGIGGKSGTGEWTSISIFFKSGTEKDILVPSYCWKILLILENGENDILRVTKDTEIIAVYIPNEQGVQNNGGWQNYVCSVDFIEEKTGFDFFADLPDDIENALEAKVASF